MKRRIFIDAGGWYLAYYLGMWDFILTEFGKDAFKGVHFDGISAGGHISAYIVSAIYGEHTLRHWLENGPKHAVRINKYGGGQFAQGLYQAGYLFHKSLNKVQRRSNKKYVRAYCITDKQELYCCEKIKTHEEHAAAASSTANIPILCGYEPTRFRDKKLWDGVFYKQYDSDLDTKNMLYISFGPHFQCKNTLNLSNWIYHNNFLSLGPSFLPQSMTLKICDELFECGYNHAKNNRAELVEKFNSIGIRVY